MAPHRPASDGRSGMAGLLLRELHCAKRAAPAYRKRLGLGLSRRELDPGFSRSYRSGSGSPPQCCGPRTRTKGPPSSGSEANLATAAENRELCCETGQRPPPDHGVERPERRRGACWVTRPARAPPTARHAGKEMCRGTDGRGLGGAKTEGAGSRGLPVAGSLVF